MKEIADITVAFIHSIPYVVKRAGVKIAGQEGRFAGTRRCCNPGKGDFQGVVQSVKKPFASFNVQGYILVNGMNTPLVKPEALLSGKNASAFTNDWVHAS